MKYLGAKTIKRDSLVVGEYFLWLVQRRSLWYFRNKAKRGRASTGSHPVSKLKLDPNTPGLTKKPGGMAGLVLALV